MMFRRSRHHDAPETPATSVVTDDGHPLLSLADVIAPTSMEIERDSLRIDDRYYRTLAITDYPRTVTAGWLDRFIDLNEPLDLVFHITPQKSGPVVRRLNRRLAQFHASRLLDERYGKISSAESKVALTDIESIRDRVQRGDERLFVVSCYVGISASTLDDLHVRTARVQAALDNVQLGSRPATYEQDLGWRSLLPECRDLLLRGISLDTSSLVMGFPFTSSGMPLDYGVLYGTVPNGSLVILDPFGKAMENANHVIIGKSGGGKSFLCKLTALRHMTQGTDVVIIDPEDEYLPLCWKCHGQYISLELGSGFHINPFDLPAPVEEAEQSGKFGDPLADTVTMLHGLLDVMLGERGPNGRAPLTQQEKSLLDIALYQTYRNAGITSNPQTHTRPAPLLRDLYAVLSSGECGIDETGLSERLRRYVDGSLSGLFSGPTNVQLTNRLVVICVQNLDSELRPLGLYLIANFVESRMRGILKKRLLIIDEAWTLMQHEEGAKFLASLARCARKRWLGLVTITQNAEDFLTSLSGRTILAQSSVQVLLRQDAATIESVCTAFQLSVHERQFLLGAAKGNGLLFARGSHAKVTFEASALEYQMATTDPQEIAENAEQLRAMREASRMAPADRRPLGASIAVRPRRVRRRDNRIGGSVQRNKPDTRRIARLPTSGASANRIMPAPPDALQGHDPALMDEAGEEI
jgi:type IV secretory pathway VirB4 component